MTMSKNGTTTPIPGHISLFHYSLHVCHLTIRFKIVSGWFSSRVVLFPSRSVLSKQIYTRVCIYIYICVIINISVGSLMSIVIVIVIDSILLFVAEQTPEIKQRLCCSTRLANLRPIYVIRYHIYIYIYTYTYYIHMYINIYVMCICVYNIYIYIYIYMYIH